MAPTTKFNALTGIAFLATAVMALGAVKASAADMQSFKSLCAKNAMCSSETTREGVLFKLQRAGRTELILCTANGSCEVKLARGVRHPVKDVEARLTMR